MKLDSRTVSCYFIGYSKRSRGYKFYDPTTKSIFEREMLGSLRMLGLIREIRIGILL